MANSNSYMKNYMLARYHKRMSEARNKLGGKCFKCNSIEDLQLDHINPQTKNFTVAHLWNSKKEVFDLEISKCQLLCKKCCCLNNNHPLEWISKIAKINRLMGPSRLRNRSS